MALMNCCCGDPVLIAVMSGEMYVKQGVVRVGIANYCTWGAGSELLAFYDSTDAGNWIFKRQGRPDGIEIEVRIQVEPYDPIKALDVGSSVSYESWYTHRIMYLLITDGTDTVEYENIGDIWRRLQATTCINFNASGYDSDSGQMRLASDYGSDYAFSTSEGLLAMQYYQRLLDAPPGDDYVSLTVSGVSGGIIIKSDAPACDDIPCSHANSTVSMKATVIGGCSGYTSLIDNIGTIDGYYSRSRAVISDQKTPCPPGGLKEFSDITGGFGSRLVLQNRFSVHTTLNPYITAARYSDTVDVAHISTFGFCGIGGVFSGFTATLAISPISDTFPTDPRSFDVVKLSLPAFHGCDFTSVGGTLDYA